VETIRNDRRQGQDIVRDFGGFKVACGKKHGGGDLDAFSLM